MPLLPLLEKSRIEFATGCNSTLHSPIHTSDSEETHQRKVKRSRSETAQAGDSPRSESDDPDTWDYTSMDNNYNQYGAYLEARARDRELHEEFLRSRNRPQAAPPTQHIDFEMETVGMPAPPANGRLYQEGESVTCLEMHVPLDQIPDHLTWAPIPPQGDYICVQKDEDEPRFEAGDSPTKKQKKATAPEEEAKPEEPGVNLKKRKKSHHGQGRLCTSVQLVNGMRMSME